MRNSFYNYLVFNSTQTGFKQKVSTREDNYLIQFLPLCNKPYVECEGIKYQVTGHHITVNDKIVGRSQYHHTIDAKKGSEEYKFHIYYSKNDDISKYTKTRLCLETEEGREEKSVVDHLIISESLQEKCQNAIAEYKAQWIEEYARVKNHYHDKISHITHLSGNMTENKGLWLKLTAEVLEMLQPSLQWWDDSYLVSAYQVIDSCRQAIREMPDSSSGEDSEEDESPVTEAGDKSEEEVSIISIKKPGKDHVKNLCDQALITSVLFDQLQIMLADPSSENTKLQKDYIELITAIEKTQEMILRVRSIDYSKAVTKCLDKCIEGRLDLKNRVMSRLLANNDFDLIKIICNKEGKEATESVIQRAENDIKERNYKDYMRLSECFDLPLTEIFHKVGMSYIEVLWEKVCWLKERLNVMDRSCEFFGACDVKLTETRFFLTLAIDSRIMDNMSDENKHFEVLHHIVTGDDMEAKSMIINAISNSDYAKGILSKLSNAIEEADLPGAPEYSKLAEDVNSWKGGERLKKLSVHLNNIVVTLIDTCPSIRILKEQLLALQYQYTEQGSASFLESFHKTHAKICKRLQRITNKLLEFNCPLSLEIAIMATRYHYEKEIERYGCLLSINDLQKKNKPTLNQKEKSRLAKKIHSHLQILEGSLREEVEQGKQFFTMISSCDFTEEEPMKLAPITDAQADDPDVIAAGLGF